MFLIFNKQYRQESNLFSDLAKKIKKTSLLIRGFKGYSEIYTLDSIIIEFAIDRYVLTVRDRNQNVIVTLNCACEVQEEDELREARYHMFSNLVVQVRETLVERLEKEKTISQAEKKAVLDAELAKKKKAEEVIVNAIRRLKEL